MTQNTPDEPRREVYPHDSHEDERVRPHGKAPRADDEAVNITGGPDADLHTPAAAPTDTDTEAGASSGGGITPLKRGKAEGQ